MNLNPPAMNRLLLFLVLALSAPAVVAQKTLPRGTVTVTGGTTVRLDAGATLTLGPTTNLIETSGGRVTGGTGTIRATRDVSSGVTTDVGGLGFVIEATSAPGLTTITRGHTPQSGEGNTGIARFYDVEPTVDTRLGADVRFAYDEAELDGSDQGLNLYRADSQSGRRLVWEHVPANPNTSDNYLAVRGLETIAGRWTASPAEASLPVEFVAFGVTLDGTAVALAWETASETNNAGFEVEMAAPGEDFVAYGFVEGHGTTTEKQTYTHRIEDLGPGVHRFRLRQVDFDGAFAFSAEVEAMVGVPGSHVLSAISPNPFSLSTRFTLAVPVSQVVTIDLYDALGRRQALLHHGALDGGTQHTFQVEGQTLPSGTYFLRVTGERFSETRLLTRIQ